MKRRRLHDLLSAPGHIVAVRTDDDPVMGRTWQALCIEENCDYLGPMVTCERRALVIGEEHRRKSAGKWTPAR
jgi:hypothetical protein